MKIHLSLVAAVMVVACADAADLPGGGGSSARDGSICTDSDGDEHGDGCAAGGDCDDDDPAIQRGCLRCTRPAEGCACDDASKPVSCFLKPSEQPDGGAMMCHEGTRYCRDREWSDCESVFSYPRPETGQLSQAVIMADAGPTKCSDCEPNCFTVRDNLNPGGALDGSANGTVLNDAGGLGLGHFPVPDSGMSFDAGMYDANSCMLNTAPDQDCDGILDPYDPYPNQKPFETTNPAIFLDLDPGETGTGNINLTFKVNTADVYLLVDQTGSMENERDNLQQDLTSGDFVNNAAYQCTDFDYNGVPNNEQKSLGIIGAIRCYIRNVNFGLGFFREIPFKPYADSGGFLDFDDTSREMVAFRNLQDITGSVSAINSNVLRLNTASNASWPEDTTVALNTLVTGNGMYFGVDRPTIPTRSGCPAGTWGYPCFRDGAIPIVIVFTDAPMHNGPPQSWSFGGTAPDNYDSSNLKITAGTSTTATMVASNDTFQTANDLGDLTSRYITVVGDTTAMTSNLSAAALTCDSGSSPTSPDAFFKFNLTAPKTVTITTEGSDFDTVLGLWNPMPVANVALPTYPDTNDDGSNPYNFNSVNNKWVTASGDDGALASDFSANDLGCGAYPGTRDATFSFKLDAPTRVALDTVGSTFGTSLSLFSAAPPTLPMFTSITNSNDTTELAYPVVGLNGTQLGFSGDTSNAGIQPSYPSSFLGCGSADASPEAVYTFTLTNPMTRVRLSTEGSALDTVVSLVDNNTIPVWRPASGNEAAGTAANVGPLDGKVFRYTGSTLGMGANYLGHVIGCGAVDSAPDAVFAFKLDTPRTVQIDTTGSGFDTVAGLFVNMIAGVTTPSPPPNLLHETGATAHYVGTVNGQRIIASGATSNTSTMAANYTATQICPTTPTSTTSPDAVFKFHVDTPTRVEVNTTDSTFNTVLSLHDGPLPDAAITTLSSNTNEAAASAQPVSNVSSKHLRYDGNTSSMAANMTIYDGLGCGAADNSPDAVYAFTVGTAGTYEISTAGTAWDTVLGLWAGSPSTPTFLTNYTTSTDKAGGGNTKAAANDAGTIDGKWVSFTGNGSGWTRDSSYSSCNADNNAGIFGIGATKDGWYKFTLATPRTIRIDTAGSSFNTVIALFRADNSEVVPCANDNNPGGGDLITQTQLAAGTYYVLIKPDGGSGLFAPPATVGNYRITFRDVTAGSNLTDCNDDGITPNGASKLTKYLNAGNYYAVVKGKAQATKGAYSLTIKHVEWADAANRLTYNDDISGTNNKSLIDRFMDTGDYWVVVKGTSVTEKGAYTLTIRDADHPPVAGWLECNDNASGTDSSITRALPAGNYYAVVKSKASGAAGNYTLGIRDTSVPLATALQCDANSGANSSSLLERDLAAGTYRAIVKGTLASDKAPYRLLLRDVNALPANRLSCDNDSGGGNKSALQYDLAAGTYTAIIKGDNSSGSGPYKLTLRDATTVNTSDATTICHDDVSSDESSSKLTQSLAAGTYWVGVKGFEAPHKGVYQLNIGAGPTHQDTYVPPTWNQTKAALKAKKARVMTVLSCKDSPWPHGSDFIFLNGDCDTARDQAKQLANDTGALNGSLQPLVFDIKSNGDNMSKTVVDGVASLVQYLEMNVKVQVVFQPDANPGFVVSAAAIDSATDDCNGLNAPAAEHLKCKPGATPKFTVSFTNPIGAPVPLNSFAKDPKGGYNFRAELIADDQYVVDKVPIYIIPKEVTNPGPPAPVIKPTGSYWQDLSSGGCAASGSTYLPDWKDLTWSGSLPNGTTVSFSGCTASAPAGLSTCTPTLFATITGGVACTDNGPCGAGGFCSAAGNCNKITAKACTNDDDCYEGATCLTGKCVYPAQPVYVGDPLGSQNFSPNLRVKIDLTANTQTNVGPTLNNWQINYVCKSSL